MSSGHSPRHRSPDRDGLPTVRGDETRSERNYLARQMQEWRTKWSRRLLGGWVVLVALGATWGGDIGLAVALYGTAATFAGAFLVQARLLTALGSEHKARPFRIAALYFILVILLTLGLWLL